MKFFFSFFQAWMSGLVLCYVWLDLISRQIGFSFQLFKDFFSWLDVMLTDVYTHTHTPTHSPSHTHSHTHTNIHHYLMYFKSHKNCNDFNYSRRNLIGACASQVVSCCPSNFLLLLLDFGPGQLTSFMFIHSYEAVFL